MRRRIFYGLVAASALVGVTAYTAPAGDPHPMIVRVVTIGDRTGPAFYSSLEQGYRFVGGETVRAADAIMAGSGLAPEAAAAQIETAGIKGH
ncbi:hypothetical protein [Jiella mangrovi]|uniref:DUF1318 domain-containing protein n=1 Tax=Jiella mangrovi TaxID=2821407 RepID=A0ABS4BBZ5_9HYPH|nr:hypothetical protein [Jiella mangrovi]MBP0614062.1 hypothetical protein [Jiella mangrovi]